MSNSARVDAYRPELDGLRALSILSVLAVHAGLPFARGGGIGVDVFFVLSGYLITSVLLREWAGNGTINLPNFYVRRALRLFPALFTMLAAALAVAALWSDEATKRATYQFVFYTFVYVANWARAYGIDHPWLGHCWSLSIEEQFYLLWPPVLVLLLRSRVGLRRILGILLVLVIAVAANRAWLWTGREAFNRIYNGLDTRGDALLIGCALALLHACGVRPANKWVALVCAGLVCALAIGGEQLAGPELMLGRGLATVVACAIAFSLSTVVVTPPAFLRMPLLVWIGKLSYSLYVWHLPAIHLVGWRSGWHERQLVPLRLILAFALAVISYYLIERPFLRLKNRVAGGRKSKLKPAPLSREPAVGCDLSKPTGVE